MAESRIKIDIDGLDRFLAKVERSSGDALKRKVINWLDASGMQLLEEVQNQIITLQVVDTRLLLNSFHKGDSDNIWRISKGGLTLDVGTKVKYARWVNDGHFTVNPNTGRDRRWVPGRWIGDRFEYDPSERESGMLLAIQWIDGRPYWDNALAIFEKMFEKSFEKKFKEWVKEVGW